MTLSLKCFLLLVLHLSNCLAIEDYFDMLCSKLPATEFLLDYDVVNDGCLLECYGLRSSSEVYKDYLDESVVYPHRLSKISCGNGRVCDNGDCVQIAPPIVQNVTIAQGRNPLPPPQIISKVDDEFGMGF